MLLKNGANRDMQDNKVRCGLRAGGQARRRLRMWGLPSPPLPSPPGEKQRHREEQEGQGRGPRSRSEGGGLCREGSGSSPPPARPPACARPSRKGLRCPRLGLRPRGLRLPASPRCAHGHARLPRRLSCCASSPLLSTGTCPVGLSSSELGATPPLPGSSSLLFSLFPLSVLVHVFSLLALTFSRFCRFPSAPSADELGALSYVALARGALCFARSRLRRCCLGEAKLALGEEGDGLPPFTCEAPGSIQHGARRAVRPRPRTSVLEKVSLKRAVRGPLP